MLKKNANREKGGIGVATLILIGLVIVAIAGWLFYSRVYNAKKSFPANPAEIPGAPVFSLDENNLKGKEYVDLVASRATETNTIDISNCIPNPDKAKFILGSTVTFVNQSDKDRLISFSPSFSITVPAKSSLAEDFAEWKYPGVRAYSCDKQASVGVIYTSTKTE